MSTIKFEIDLRKCMKTPLPTHSSNFFDVQHQFFACPVTIRGDSCSCKRQQGGALKRLDLFCCAAVSGGRVLRKKAATFAAASLFIRIVVLSRSEDRCTRLAPNASTGVLRGRRDHHVRRRRVHYAHDRVRRDAVRRRHLRPHRDAARDPALARDPRLHFGARHRD